MVRQDGGLRRPILRYATAATYPDANYSANAYEKSEKRGVQAAINVRKTLGAVDFTTKTEPTPMIFSALDKTGAFNATLWRRLPGALTRSEPRWPL